jgi:hypothetical protein
MADSTVPGPGRDASSAPPPPGVGPEADPTMADAYAVWGAESDPAAAAGAAWDATVTNDAAEVGAVARDAVQEVIDASADFLITGRDYIRQEAEGVMREKIAPPLQEVGVTVASMWAAVTLLVLGLIFVAVAAMIFLSQLVGPALAFLIVGVIYLIGAGIFLFIKVQQVKRSAEALEASQKLRGTGPESAPGAATAAPAPASMSRKAKP